MADQPRVPAGSPEGGQWAGTKSGGRTGGTVVKGDFKPPAFMVPGDVVTKDDIESAQEKLEAAIAVHSPDTERYKDVGITKVTGIPYENPDFRRLTPRNHTVTDRGTQTFAIEDLTATQPGLHKGAIRKYVANINIQKSSGDTVEGDPDGIPMRVVTFNGKNYITQGHHRIAALKLLGKTHVRVPNEVITMKRDRRG